MSSYGYYDLYNLSGGWGIVALLIGILSIAVSIYLLVLAVKLMRRALRLWTSLFTRRICRIRSGRAGAAIRGTSFIRAPGASGFPDGSERSGKRSVKRM